MAVTLELPPDVETHISEESAQKGRPLFDDLMTIIQERHGSVSDGLETYLLSESGLAKDWSRPDEDEAWQDL